MSRLLQLELKKYIYARVCVCVRERESQGGGSGGDPVFTHSFQRCVTTVNLEERAVAAAAEPGKKRNNAAF